MAKIYVSDVSGESGVSGVSGVSGADPSGDRAVLAGIGTGLLTGALLLVLLAALAYVLIGPLPPDAGALLLS